MLTIINDIHIGARRQGGTTPQSQEALRGYLQQSLRSFLEEHDGHVVIAGDLFDAFEVDLKEVLATYETMADFVHDGGYLTLIQGNHDWSPKAGKLSSFHFLAKLIQGRFPDGVRIVDTGLTAIGDSVWAIPHMPNQDLFDLELGKALDYAEVAEGLSHLILHANYDNRFTVNSDHSLNVSREVAEKFKDAGVTLVFAHEHQARSDLGGSVVVMGNQWPSSVSDCLGNAHKSYATIRDGLLAMHPVWSREGDFGYSEVNWHDLDPDKETTEGFIRVVGTAQSSEAEAVIEAVAKYRTKSRAFVVGNAVKVDGLAEMDAMGEVSAESIKSFDVLAALMAECTEREQEVLRCVLR